MSLTTKLYRCGEIAKLKPKQIGSPSLTFAPPLLALSLKIRQDKIESLDVEGVWNLKPLLDGREVMKMLPRMPKGPHIGEVISDLLQWQIENPDRRKDEAQQWMLEKWKQYV